jgi:UDPglucose 6-dehydrogenase
MVIRKCSIVGLGKLGACMAAAIAGRGFGVIGVDKDPGRVGIINRKEPPIFEPGLKEMLKKNGRRIIATGDCRQAVLESDITFIVVPTPSMNNGDFSLKFVSQAAKEIALALAQKTAYHIVVITSTVLPSAMDSDIKPLLERYSGKACGRDFGLCYNPEFIALGTVIRNFLNPDFILIGESDRRAGMALVRFYKKVCQNNPQIARMNFINAELTKIAVNSFITTKITFANMLAELSEKIPGGDVDIVTGALGLDTRIGKRYLKGGLGYGGPCFPRDNAALAYVARRLRAWAGIPRATDIFNKRIVKQLFGIVRSKVSKGAAVGILGLSYKPLSNVTEESQAFLLAEKLIKAKIKVILYDPLAMDSLKRAFGNRAIYAKSPKEAVRSSRVIVIANPDPEFIKLQNSVFTRPKRPLAVIDCWRLLRGHRLDKLAGIEYIPLGIG